MASTGREEEPVKEDGMPILLMENMPFTPEKTSQNILFLLRKGHSSLLEKQVRLLPSCPTIQSLMDRIRCIMKMWGILTAGL
jgi:hypothetical protein